MKNCNENWKMTDNASELEAIHKNFLNKLPASNKKESIVNITPFKKVAPMSFDISWRRKKITSQPSLDMSKIYPIVLQIQKKIEERMWKSGNSYYNELMKSKTIKVKNIVRKNDFN